MNYCCTDWEEATQAGTDAEGYGSLIRAGDTRFCGVGTVPPIRFCPWCGKPVAERAPEKRFLYDREDKA